MSALQLSVCIITYNHAKFIKQAIDSVLSQRRTFSWEIIIADDCSQDDTAELLLAYQQRYPSEIRLILQKENVGPARNWYDLIKAAKGKYIAYFEGDDYWTNVNKLQKQVDFLEENQDYSGCFHQVDRLFEKTEERLPGVPDHVSSPFTLETLLTYGNIVPTCSLVFKNELSWLSRELCDKAPFGDYLLHISNLKAGPYGYLNENMAVYRIHSAGVHGPHAHSEHRLMQVLQKEIVFWNVIRKAGLLSRIQVRRLFKNVAEILLSDYWTKDKMRYFRLLINYFYNDPAHAARYVARRAGL